MAVAFNATYAVYNDPKICTLFNSLIHKSMAGIIQWKQYFAFFIYGIFIGVSRNITILTY